MDDDLTVRRLSPLLPVCYLAVYRGLFALIISHTSEFPAISFRNLVERESKTVSM